MNLKAEKAWLRVWTQRLSYRRVKLAFFRERSKRPKAQRLALIKKWEKLAREAEREVVARRKRVKAKTPKVSTRGRQAIVRKACSYTGVHERYRNGGGIINTWQRRFGFGNVAWCGLFCGNMLQHGGVRGVTSRIAGVALIEDDAKARRGPFAGWSWGTANAKPGDLAVIGGYGQHVGMVVSRNADGSLNTVEGNAGDAVRRLRRSPGQVRGIAHIRA